MKQRKSPSSLVVRDLKINLGDKKIITGIDLTIKSKELHVVMGPNGSGKSTLTYGLMGSSTYSVEASEMSIDTHNLIDMPPEDRAKFGLLLAFQNPIAVPGVTISNFLRTAYKEMHSKSTFSAIEFHKHLLEVAKYLALPKEFLSRSLNDGFSGGEKKKLEMVQLLTLEPKFAVLDEIDTGLDVDALKVVSAGVTQLLKNGTGVLLITHYQRILNYLKPSHVHILKSGAFVREGGNELVKYIEEKGYAAI